jgi:hypothetical protein
MGQTLTCDCFEHINFENADEKIVQERLQQLVKGDNFTRSALLGLTSKEMFVKLTEDYSAIQWKIDKTTWTKEEFGEFDLTAEVKKLKTTGESSLQIIGKDDSTLLEIKHKDATTRDKWVLAVNELLQSWIDEPDKKPKSKLSADGTSNKAEYFKKREEEIKEREKAAQERKAKYSSGGMQFTAQVMASRA